MKMLLCSIGSRRRKTTLHFGIEVARALSAEMTLLGVVSDRKKVKELECILNDSALQAVRDGFSVEVRVEAGNAEDIVIAHTRKAAYDMVAVGSLGRRRSTKSFFDTVAMRIVEQATGSVLVIKGERERLARVLICASGADHGHLPVWAGASVACGAGAEATVLHVMDPMPGMYVGLEQMEETLAELLKTDTDMARELRWAAQVVKAECDVSELKLRRGLVADEILREGQSGDFDLIVLGSSRSAGGLTRALMGDVTRDIVCRAERPVLVVRPKD
jgi:nucleotide-binding universal stress UspA family protein